MDNVITIKRGSEQLADGTDTGGRVTSLRINGALVVEEGKPLRAAVPVFFDRGNMTNVIEIAIHRQHGNPLLALDAALTRRQTLPGVEDLTIGYGWNGQVYTALSTACKWDRTQCELHAHSNAITFPVTARDFTTTIDGEAVEGDGEELGFRLPYLLETEIDPLIIPAGRVATLLAGQLLVAREVQIDGELRINGGQLTLIAA